MHPDDEQYDLVYKMIDANGNEVILGKLGTVRVIDGEPVQEEYRIPTDELTFTMRAYMRNVRGFFDMLLGWDTPAARRCRRSGKRLKEKNRRKKLKGGIAKHDKRRSNENP